MKEEGARPEKSLAQEVRSVAEPLARALELEILEIQCFGKLTRPLVRLVMDKEGGIGIQDCEQFHQALMRTWELTKSREWACRFEVSSPGLDRPLKDLSDFQRVVGKLVRATLRRPIEKDLTVLGRLTGVTKDGILLEMTIPRKPQQRKMVEIKWEDIVKARLEVEF